jgi:TetR/AcrR family transcriptional repressor of nem operon
MEKREKKTSRDRLLDVAFNEVYIYGYCGASTANILKKAEVPRGSMYHHFESKKALVLAMIEERLIPKVREFFDFEMQKGATSLEVIDHTMKKISKNKMLIKNGCPLHRLMFEMGALDEDISKACEVEFENIRDNFTKVLEYGMKRGEIKKMDAKSLAEFIISSSWGMLSRTPLSSSSERFLRDMEHIYILIKV